MIYIKEDIKKSLCGQNSLFITCDNLDNDIINTIKSCGTFANNDEGTWEVPSSCLAYILDNLTYFDNIKLELRDENDVQDKYFPSLEYKTKPFDYQLEGIKYGLNHDKWLLLDAPGLGKSLQLIYLAEELKAQRGIEHCLIICGIASLRTNWKKEIKKHSKLDCMILGEKINSKGNVNWLTISKRVEQLKNKIDEFFIIVNIETLRDNRIINVIKNGKNKIDCIFFDECHKAKGWNSQQGKNLMELDAKYKVGATGTLLMNTPLDTYVPLVWAGKERKRSVTKFKNTFCNLDFETKRVVGFKNMDVLKDEIDSCSLRRTKDTLDLPPKTIINEVIDMEDAQNKFYNEIKNATKAEYKQLAINSCDKIKLKTKNLLSLITRLRQATSCPQILTSMNIESIKIKRAVELVDEILSNGDSVVIFSNFKEPIRELEDKLKIYNPLVGTGDMKDDEVSKNIDTFQENPNRHVFLGTISKMGTGVTLTKASYMIFIDQPWTEALYTQACDRIYRIGSKKPVFIYNLMCYNTIDYIVSKIIKVKEAFSDYVIDDVHDDKTMEILNNYLSEL